MRLLINNPNILDSVTTLIETEIRAPFYPGIQRPFFTHFQQGAPKA